MHAHYCKTLLRLAADDRPPPTSPLTNDGVFPASSQTHPPTKERQVEASLFIPISSLLFLSMLTPVQKAAVARASAADFVGVELLSCPDAWPQWCTPAPSPSRPALTFEMTSPPRNVNRTRSSSVVTINEPRRPHIAVLDSSFNPPTLAHLRLAATAFPPPQPNPNAQRVSSPKSPSGYLRDAASYFASHGPQRDPSALSPIGDAVVSPDPSPGPYTARLLLYSMRNADKLPGIADASPEQRAEMMLAQAAAMPPNTGATAVALVSAPTFVDKAKALAKMLGDVIGKRRRSGSEPSTPLQSTSDEPPAITFLVGTDTLLRIFDPRYYPVGSMDSALEELFSLAWLVCARRGSGGTSADAAQARRQEDALLARADVAKYVAKGRIRLVRMTEAVGDVSSTRVRSALRMGAGASALRGLCADEVAKYVLEQGLYRSTQ